MKHKSLLSTDPLPAYAVDKPSNHDAFVRVSFSLLRNPSFKSLSANAQVLYIRMMAEAKGKWEFQFPQRCYHGIMARATFQRAKNELIDAGFIEQMPTNKCDGLATTFRFDGHAKWRTDNPDKL